MISVDIHSGGQMRSKKWLWNNIVMPIYRQMYKEAEPSADFDELLNSLIAEGRKFEWDTIKNYYLSDSRQSEIINEFKEKYKLTRRELERVKATVYLGCAPNSYNGDD